MQTRIFEKPAPEIYDAIIEISNEDGIKCFGFKPGSLYVPKNLRYAMQGKKIMWTNDGFDGVTDSFVCRKHKGTFFVEWQWELKGEPISNPSKPSSDQLAMHSPDASVKQRTIVRLRIKTTTTNDSSQSTNEETYQGWFKALADALFINAIEITPATME